MSQPLLTAELEAKLERFAYRLRDYRGAGWASLAVSHILQVTAELGIGLVDTDRQRHWIDERVYEGALHRGHRWQAELEVWTGQLHPRPAIWRGLCAGDSSL